MLLLGAVDVAVAVAFALAVAVASRELVSLNEAFHTLEREQRPVDSRFRYHKGIVFHKHCCLSPCEGRTVRDASNRKLH